jgi:NADP-dependent 3-hydroxy acid dehydrogenase YdfG
MAGEFRLMPVLTEQVAVVTGASSGIGKAIAEALAAQGMKLCLVGRNRHALEAVAARVRGMASCVLVSQTDLTVDDHIERLKSDVQQAFGQVDVLVHSAGIFAQGKLQSASIEDLDRQYRTNVRAPYLLTQGLLPLLKVRPGQIVFINSSVGLRARADVSQYAATKHALKAIADSLREEVNADGIRVLNVFPGRTATPGQEAIFRLEARTYRPELLLQAEDVAAVVLNALTLPRTAEVTDISIRPLAKSY